MKIARHFLICTICALSALSFSQISFAGDGFVKLFDGETLNGWKQEGGKAKYMIENGVIIGTAIPNTPNTPNTFLCTKKQYANFILELEFKVDPGLNSGVQIRSHVYEKDVVVTIRGKERKRTAGTVYGYQVEIDPSERAYTGGIYDEARSGWLNDLSKNEKARIAFKQNEWNVFRIVADGNSLKTWINGVPAADLKDDQTAKGFIALQVHGVGKKPELVGKQVRWRNIHLKKLP